MMIKPFILFLFIFTGFFCSAQSNQELLTIKNKKVSTEEFSRFCDVNNYLKFPNHKDSVTKYLNRFIFYKLNIAEAESQGLDKTPEFQTDINLFRNQMLREYIFDMETVYKFAKEAYDRGKNEIRIRQILVRISPLASAKDSLIAYSKAMNIRKRLLNGEDFNSLAEQLSDDPSAIINKGELWYIKPFAVPYPVENYIYGNSTQKFSMPIRSTEGFHIIEILDRRASKGKSKVAQIMLSFPEKCDEKCQLKIKEKADSIYQLAITGNDFSQLVARFSDDKGNLNANGELPWFETGIMPHEFEEASFALKNDSEISIPIKTRYGWHIIKRISTENYPPYELMKEQLQNMVINSDKGDIAKNKMIEKLKTKYSFKDLHALDDIAIMLDSTIFEAKWEIPYESDLTGVLFSVDKNNFTKKDFIDYIKNNQQQMFPVPINNYLYWRYNQYINECLTKHHTQIVENSNSEFKTLLDEFRARNLNRMILEKDFNNRISADPSGIEEYYLKNKANYNKSLVADVSIFSYHIEKPSKLQKQFDKLKELAMADSLVETTLRNSIDNGFKFEVRKQLEEGENQLADAIFKRFRDGELKFDQKTFVFELQKQMFHLNDIIKISDKPLELIQNKVAADYQKYIEKNKYDELTKKYQVTINQKELDLLFTR